MAYSDSDSTSPNWWRRNWSTFVWLVLIMALAGFFRIGFNYEPAINGGDLRLAGNDDYYHLRVANHVQTEGEHLIVDPLLNYPLPAKNPRPPVFDWHAAIEARFIHWFSGWDTGKSSLYALDYGSATWGILTCIPIWLIGRSLYSNRAGLWAAFLIAASPAHIQRAGFGLGDHDAFIVFFLVLGFYFLIRAIQNTRDNVVVERWNHLPTVAAGLGEYVMTHLEGLAYATLAGACFATIALSWEGFPYVAAIFLIYYVSQLLVNQIRRRDSTGDLLIMMVLTTILVGLALPYYWTTGNIHTTLTSMTYLVATMVILSLALIPTRDLPSIVVLPGLGLVGLLGLGLIKVVFPDIGQQLLSANGYFVQSKLYSTIAEAQRTDLGAFVFGIGFMTFFLALVGSVWAVIRFFAQRERDHLFVALWGLFSIYMAFAAARFVFNAAPAFSVLAGWMVDKLVGWMNLRERFRDFESQRHESLVKGVRSLMGAKQVAGSFFIAFTLIIPSVWFSFDAGFPGEARANYRQNHPGARELIDNRTGAFGQGFLQQDWIDLYRWLSGQDALDAAGRPVDCKDRPAHMSWWDYGFWEAALGCHPTVADNFQNGHQLAGRFLASQSEQEALEWMSLRLIEGNRAQNKGVLTEPMKRFLDGVQPGLSAALSPLLHPNGYDQAQTTLRTAVPTLEEHVDIYAKLKDLTGKNIGYFLTDLRMLPLDFPETSYIEAGSIFYAPVFLANKNPDDFVQTIYEDVRNQEYQVQAYEFGPDNLSRQIAPPKIFDAQGNQYYVGVGAIYRATPDGKRIDFSFNGGQPIQLARTKLQFKDAFYETMFYKGYVGGGRPPSGDYSEEFLRGIPNSGKDLKHWRLVQNTTTIRLLKYYEGAGLSGVVRMADGEPLGGVTVEAFDDLGIRHDIGVTDFNGTYRLVLPFGSPDANGTLQNTTVRVVSGGLQLDKASFLVTERMAHRKADYNLTHDFVLQSGTVNGQAFLDRDRSGDYNSSIDAVAARAEIRIEDLGTTSEENGRFTIRGATPGVRTVFGFYPAYDNATASAQVLPNGTAEVSLAFQASKIQVEGGLANQSGMPLINIPVNFTSEDPAADYTENATTTTNSTGVFRTPLTPGGFYTVSVDVTIAEKLGEEERMVRYTGSYRFEVPIGSPAITITKDQLVLERQEAEAA